MSTKPPEEILFAQLPLGERMMRKFCFAVKHGRQIDPFVLDWFRSAFHRVLQGEDPRAALHIKRPSYRPRDQGERRERKVRLTQEVLVLQMGGASKTKAIYQVASKSGLAEDTLDGYVKEFRDEARARVAWIKLSLIHI